MASFNELQKTETNAHHKNIFEILAKHENINTSDTVQDGAEEIILDAGELETIKNELAENVQEARGNVQTATEMREHLLFDFPARINAIIQEKETNAALAQNTGIVQDGFSNPVSGIGTYIDPGMSTEAFTPVSILPQEASAYYANGGIPSRIINKKAGCLSLNGIHFESSVLSADDLQKLEDYANKTGFFGAYTDVITQSLIFGGAVIYPVLADDNPIISQYNLNQLKTKYANKTDFIKYWVVADRWNCVFVPKYNITAQDYLFAKSLFIPLGGCRVNTERMALIRPLKLPFWAAIQQMGWSTSDFEGWIKDFEAYQIMKMSLPVMAQQSSLMYHSLPADGLIIENGSEYAKQFFKENEEQMRKWSILHPRTINSIGEIKILERTYSGFRDLINESKIALCAAAGMQESIIFAERPSGLASDNEDDITLKQSETIRLLFNTIEPCFHNVIQLLIYSCFGVNSEQARNADSVHIKKDTGVIMSDNDKAQLGQAFSTIAGQLVSIGMPLDTAVEIARKFTPADLLDNEVLANIKQTDTAEGLDSNMWDILQAGR
jgi:hypothetical protein